MFIDILSLKCMITYLCGLLESFVICNNYKATCNVTQIPPVINQDPLSLEDDLSIFNLLQKLAAQSMLATIIEGFLSFVIWSEKKPNDCSKR